MFICTDKVKSVDTVTFIRQTLDIIAIATFYLFVALFLFVSNDLTYMKDMGVFLNKADESPKNSHIWFNGLS